MLLSLPSSYVENKSVSVSVSVNKHPQRMGYYKEKKSCLLGNSLNSLGGP